MFCLNEVTEFMGGGSLHSKMEQDQVNMFKNHTSVVSSPTRPQKRKHNTLAHNVYAHKLPPNKKTVIFWMVRNVYHLLILA